MKFVHLTDPHMVAPGHRLYTIDRSARFGHLETPDGAVSDLSKVTA